MNYTKTEIEQILQSGESEKVEFKANIREQGILAKLIGAFANSDGGIILIGIKEPLEIIGCDIAQLKLIFERAKSLVTPIPKVELSSLTIDNKVVGIITVSKSNEVVFSDSGVYERIGESTIAMQARGLNDRLTKFSTPATNETLAKAIEKQTLIIESLRKEIKSSNSIKSKTKDYLIGGIVGAIIGLALTLIFG